MACAAIRGDAIQDFGRKPKNGNGENPKILIQDGVTFVAEPAATVATQASSKLHLSCMRSEILHGSREEAADASEIEITE